MTATKAKIVLGDKHLYQMQRGWSRKVTVDGVEYRVGVEQGKAVRIPYKRRGQNRGYRWYGFVRDTAGKAIWEGEVAKTLGARGLLGLAGLIERKCTHCGGRGEVGSFDEKHRYTGQVACPKCNGTGAIKEPI